MKNGRIEFFFELPDKVFCEGYKEIQDIYQAFFQTCFTLMTRECRFRFFLELPEELAPCFSRSKEKYDFLMNLLYKATVNDLNDILVRKRK